MSSSSFTHGRNNVMYSHYMQLSQGTKIQAEYIWIDGSGVCLRSKTKTLKCVPQSIKDLPEWNFDGSSTKQASGDNSEVWLRPVKITPDPFRRGDNILVLCECLDPSTMEPIESNKRAHALEIFSRPQISAEKPWYGLEQEYTLFECDGVTPLGWPINGYPRPQGPYYCSNGARNAYGRQIAEAHYRCCLYAGLEISGINAEVMCGQWEYQIGPVESIDASDQLWIARYLLERVCEDFNCVVSLHPKPVKGDWNGAGCHTNYSTNSTRNDGGYNVILEQIEKLGRKHSEHIAVYGKFNEERLTGHHETCCLSDFKFGVADRGSSIRIPRVAVINGKGYYEDRRPASNMDPYEVTSIIAETTIE